MTIFPDRFETARLVLRPVTRADCFAIFDTYAQDPEVTRFLTWRPHESLADTEAYIGHCLASPPESDRTYVLTGRESGGVMGAFELTRPADHRLEFGYGLARRWWGKGLMTEALTEIVRWARHQNGIVRIGGCCDVENTGSARVMEKAGLVREGLARRWMVHPNLGSEPRDCFLYALVW